MGNNLSSLTTIKNPINTDDIHGWFLNEIIDLEEPIKNILLIVFENSDHFIKWPKKASLLWKGANRVPEAGKKLKYHKYPDEFKILKNEKQITLDSRPNGPAISAFYFADGDRQNRIGSTNKWSIHHLYSGKFKYPGSSSDSLHAVKEGNHFTQSAGLVAVHPFIDALFDEIPAIAWLFRHEAYRKFGYDPMNVFVHGTVNILGFINKNECEIAFELS